MNNLSKIKSLIYEQKSRTPELSAQDLFKEDKKEEVHTEESKFTSLKTKIILKVRDLLTNKKDKVSINGPSVLFFGTNMEGEGKEKILKVAAVDKENVYSKTKDLPGDQFFNIEPTPLKELSLAELQSVLSSLYMSEKSENWE